MNRLRARRACVRAVSAFGVAVLVAAAARSFGAEQPGRTRGDEKNWEAVAPGLVEPLSGEIKMLAPVVGRISEVLVMAKADDAVTPCGGCRQKLREFASDGTQATSADRIRCRRRYPVTC